MDPREKRNTMLDQAEAIQASAVAQGRDLTADELVAIQGKLDSADQLLAEIELLNYESA